jgi:hypothetical protein
VSLALHLDEDIDRRLVPPLRSDGYDILTVEAAGQQLSDLEQLRFATAQGRLLVSHNQVHFRRLHRQLMAEGQEHAGIVLLPQTVPLSRLIARARLLMEWVATFPDVRSRLFRWTDLQQQLVHGYRVPGSRCTEQEVRHALGWQ